MDRFTKGALYELKRRYGRQVNIIWPAGTPTVDRATGVKSTPLDSLQVNRAIVLPVSLDRAFNYDLTYIATNKNFTYGGHFDRRKVRVVLDQADIGNLDPQVGWHFAFDRKRYDFEVIESYSGVWDIIAKQVDNVDVQNHIKIEMYSLLVLDGEFAT